MAGEANGRIRLIGMAGSAQFLLRLAQDSGIVGTMRHMAKITLARGQVGMRLIDLATQILVTLIASVIDIRDHERGIGAGVGIMAGGAIPAGEWLVRVTDRRFGIGQILPVTIPANSILRPPQLFWIRPAEIMARATGPIPKRRMHVIQAIQRRWTQTRRDRISWRRGREKGRRRGCGRPFRPGIATTAIEDEDRQD